MKSKVKKNFYRKKREMVNQETENVSKTIQKGKRGQLNFLRIHLAFHKYFTIIFREENR